jgi:hypothetical protein
MTRDSLKQPVRIKLCLIDYIVDVEDLLSIQIELHRADMRYTRPYVADAKSEVLSVSTSNVTVASLAN